VRRANVRSCDAYARCYVGVFNEFCSDDDAGVDQFQIFNMMRERCLHGVCLESGMLGTSGSRFAYLDIGLHEYREHRQGIDIARLMAMVDL
jgi:hypothetical protein